MHTYIHIISYTQHITYMEDAYCGLALLEGDVVRTKTEIVRV